MNTDQPHVPAPATSIAAEPAYRCSVDEFRGADWQRVVSHFDDAVIDQSWAFAEACWGSDRTSSIVLFDGDDVVAACLLILLRAPLLPIGIAHAKFGPLLRRGAGTYVGGYAHELLRRMRAEYVDRRGLFLRVMPQAAPGGDGELQRELATLGFRHSAIDDDTRYLVHVATEPDALRAGLKSKWRSHLKKAEREDLRIDHGSDATRVAEFLALYASMREAKTFGDDRALSRLAAVFAASSHDGSLSVWLCRAGDHAIAGAVVAGFGDTALYWFGASNAAGRERRAGFLLHWAIVTELHSTGYRWYDLGGDCGNPGLRQFKAGLAGRGGVTPQLPGHFDLAPGAFSAAAARSLFWLRHAVGNARRRQ